MRLGTGEWAVLIFSSLSFFLLPAGDPLLSPSSFRPAITLSSSCIPPATMNPAPPITRYGQVLAHGNTYLNVMYTNDSAKVAGFLSDFKYWLGEARSKTSSWVLISSTRPIKESLQSSNYVSRNVAWSSNGQGLNPMLGLIFFNLLIHMDTKIA